MRKPPPTPIRKLTDPNVLRQLYCDQRLSLNQVAKQLRVSKRTVNVALVRFGIPRRTRGEGLKLVANQEGAEVIYTEEEKRLLALAIDLEGAIYLVKRRNHCNPAISIVNINHPLIEHIYSLARTGHTCSYSRRNYRRAWMWNVNSVFQVENLLKQIVPYLIAKQEQGKLLLEFCQSRIQNFASPLSERDKVIYEKLRELNRRGIVSGELDYSYVKVDLCG